MSGCIYMLLRQKIKVTLVRYNDQVKYVILEILKIDIRNNILRGVHLIQTYDSIIIHNTEMYGSIMIFVIYRTDVFSYRH